MYQTTSTNSIASLDSYINKACKYTPLTLIEETELANDWVANKNQFSSDRIVLTHLRFVVYIASKYKGYNLPLADLIQEGNIGILKAIQKYNPSFISKSGSKARFATFAVFYIRAEIHDFVIANSKIVKMATTKAQRKLFFNLRQFKAHSGHFSLEEVNELAEMLNVKPSDVTEMENRIYNYDCSFDLPLSDGDAVLSPAEFLSTHLDDVDVNFELDQNQAAISKLLHKNLSNLDERKKDIIYSRWFAKEKSTFLSLANKYQVSVERVRQLEKNVIIKLKLQMTS